ncbi:GntR family transcriptional regulator [Nonomuraea fuscirosea]|uniref:GntR family transcriptional regulator n=1 Tax=Nonomuraea fuscirosea TaxID=1291556 RepID=UPI001C631027|nr:UTRA domain-containing protein [Nonomuraea fuscirosea]
MADQDSWSSVSMPYVLPRRADQPDAWAEEAAEHGHTGSNVLREVTVLRPPANVGAALGIREDEPVIVRRRTVLLDEQPIELADSYYPVSIAQGTRLADKRKIPGGAPTLLAELGHQLVHVEEDVSTRPATDEERKLLQLQEHEWVLVLFRLSRSRDNTPVEVSVMTMVPYGRHLRYKLSH